LPVQGATDTATDTVRACACTGGFQNLIHTGAHTCTGVAQGLAAGFLCVYIENRKDSFDKNISHILAYMCVYDMLFVYTN